MSTQKRSCKGCKYAIRLGMEWYCDYLDITGKRRPCPAGPGCTVRDDGYRGHSQIDPVRARDLYDMGMTDKEIGAEFGVSSVTVFQWRRKNELPANGCGGKKKAPGTEQSGEGGRP